MHTTTTTHEGMPMNDALTTLEFTATEHAMHTETTTHAFTATETPMHTETTTRELISTESLMSNETTKTKKQRCTREERIARLAARAKDSVCPSTIAGVVRAMTAELDPEAIHALIELLNHDHDDNGSVRRALLRYGDSAVDSLRAVAKTQPLAERVLEDMAFRNRLLEVGCF